MNALNRKPCTSFDFRGDLRRMPARRQPGFPARFVRKALSHEDLMVRPHPRGMECWPKSSLIVTHRIVGRPGPYEVTRLRQDRRSAGTLPTVATPCSKQRPRAVSPLLRASAAGEEVSKPC
jgi:hypothetical protein